MAMILQSLSVDDLDQVTGGVSRKGEEGARKVTSYCPTCKKNTTFLLYSGGRGRCSDCNTPKEL